MFMVGRFASNNARRGQFSNNQIVSACNGEGKVIKMNGTHMVILTNGFYDQNRIMANACRKLGETFMAMLVASPDFRNTAFGIFSVWNYIHHYIHCFVAQMGFAHKIIFQVC